MKKLLVLIALLFVPQVAQAQTNFCESSMELVALPPDGQNKYYAILPDQERTLEDGTPVVTHYQVAIFPVGANPNAQAPLFPATNIPKSAWVNTGVGNCWELVGGLPGIPPTATPVAASTRAIGPTSGAAWALLSNPFTRASVPVPPAVLGPSRVRPLASLFTPSVQPWFEVEGPACWSSSPSLVPCAFDLWKLTLSEMDAKVTAQHSTTKPMDVMFTSSVGLRQE